MSKVYVIGVGMTRFLRPRETNPEFYQLAKQAVARALRDANLKYADIEQGVAGYVYGMSTSGQRALYETAMAGIPIMNVHNNCSTGSTALYIAAQFIKGGQADCAIALGFDRMQMGALNLGNPFEKSNPLEPMLRQTDQLRGLNMKTPAAPQIFGNAGIEHMEKYGTKEDHFVKIAEKNHFHSSRNPYAQFQKVFSFDEIKKSDRIHGPLTKLQCCPTSDGAAAAIICSEAFMKTRGLTDQAVEILGMALTTDSQLTYDSKSLMNLAGYEMSKRAAEKVYKQTNLKPTDFDVCELHDCFSANELITYEAMGFASEGKAGEFIDRDWKFPNGKKITINPSGGLISKGHPLGATGLAQCTELVWQLRGMAGPRQISGAKLAIQHNIGLGGACVVAAYKKYNDKPGSGRPEQTSDPAVLEKLEGDEFKWATAAPPKVAANATKAGKEDVAAKPRL